MRAGRGAFSGASLCYHRFTLSTNDERPAATGDAAATLPDVLQFMRLLWGVAHGLETRSKKMTSELGVTGPQRLVLRVAGLFPGLSAGDLAAILHVHPSTLTGMLQRLTGQGLIARVPAASDRRRAVLRLTRKGARANASIKGTVEAAIADALRDTGERERAAAMRVLARLADRLQRPDSDTRTGVR